MALANVALTDTFDYWRTVTNSLVVALNDKLVYCNTSNANTVSIPASISRTSNLTLNIITSTSVFDAATANVASAYSVNTVNQMAISYGASGNNWTNAAVTSANAWTNSVGLSGNSWANTVSASSNSWANTVGSSANSWSNVVGLSANSYAVTTFAPVISPTFSGTVTFNANISNQTLTDGTTINWDVSQGAVASVTLGGNRTMAAPTNLKVGTYILHVYQDGSGGRNLTWNSIFKWPAGIVPTLTQTAGRHDMFSFVSDGTNLYGSYLPDVR
jgi:hypothetical protein